MQLNDFFNFKDLVRVMLIGSALLLLIGGLYGVFLHAMYSSQVDQVQHDLSYISDLMETRSTEAYNKQAGTEARQFKDVSDQAEELAKDIRAPSVTPSAYTYFNYWIASAAFTELTLNPKVLGLPDETVDVFNRLDNEVVLGKTGWWNREEFRGFDVKTSDYRIFLGSKPKLETHYWSFYIFVFLIAFLTVLITVKESYEFPLVPEIIYGIFLPTLFFAVYSVTAIISLTGIITFLDPSQVDMLVILLSYVLMSIISAVGALVAGVLKSRKKKA